MRSASQPPQAPELLRQARATRGWTQQETADRIRRACPGEGGACTMNPRKYAELEAGRLHPGRLHTQAICETFGKAPAALGLDAPPDEPDALG